MGHEMLVAGKQIAVGAKHKISKLIAETVREH